MFGLLNIINMMKQPHDIKSTVMISSDKWILVSIARQALSLLTSIMANNNTNKSIFSKLVLHADGGDQSLSNPESNRENHDMTNFVKKKQSLLTFDSLVSSVLDVEPTMSLETSLVLFDMLLDGPCVHNRIMLTDESLLSSGLFSADDDRPKIRNLSIIFLLFASIPHAPFAIQKFILITFNNLVTGRASLVNLSACSHSQVLDLVLDLFPRVMDNTHEYLVHLLQTLGRHSISIAQLKHLFRMMQSDGDNRPAHTHRLVQVSNQRNSQY